jgi:hypothetical protein
MSFALDGFGGCSGSSYHVNVLVNVLETLAVNLMEIRFTPE